MDLEQLATKLGVEGGIETLQDHWSAFCAQGGTDGRAFVAWLFDQGHIQTRSFVDVFVTAPIAVDTSTPAGRREAGEKGYQPLGVVGSGAMGEVLLVHDDRLKRKVAFKRMTADAARSEPMVTRFLQEAQITAQLDHPHVVPVHSFEADDVPAYTMKLIHGLTFEDLVEETRQALDSGETLDRAHTLQTRLDHFLKVCDAMAYAHSRGVLHRDLKPANIMVGAYGEVYVMDWGIARLQDKPDPSEAGQAIGTAAYMSPEQAMGRTDQLDARSDQYALGLILYELVTLRRAISGSGMSVVFRAQAGQLEPLDHVAGAHIHRDLAAIIAKATAHQPDARYPDVDALAEDVRRHLRAEAPVARPDNLWRGFLRWMARHRELTLVAFLVGLLAAATVTIGALVFAQVAVMAAHHREERLGHALGQVAEQANLADAYFLRLQGQLEGLAAAAGQVLTTAEPAAGPLYLNEHYADATTAPPDLVEVPRYQSPVSFDWPVFKLAPGVDPSEVEPRLQRLVLLRRHLRDTFLRSHAEAAITLDGEDVVQLIGHQGVPLVWAYVATEEGIHTSYPGHTGYPEDYDPRRRPWYQLATSTRGPTWGSPYIDVNGQGLILPCVMALHDPEGSLLGVAGIELTFDRIIRTLLVDPDLSGVEESYLVDDQARIVVRTSDLGTDIGGGLHGNQALVLPTLPLPQVAQAIEEGRSGYLVRGGDIVLYARLNSLGWTLVVTGDSGEMLGGLL